MLPVNVDYNLGLVSLHGDIFLDALNTMYNWGYFAGIW